MELQYIALVVPAFFLFVGIEYLVAIQKKKKDIYKFDSSVANISVGIAERLLNIFVSASFYGMFYYVYENFAIFNIPNTWYVWILLLLTTDFVWYWYHRLGHEINILWGAHIVHHHSEEFNYTVSARVTTFQALIRNIFWCSMPLLGFHPALIITISVIHAGYSFFTHTQLIGNLGWLEKVLITPSHHRVHHGSNDKYLNKNYGDLFVFWDKLFGTFQKEEEEVYYGITKPLASWNPVWANFHYWVDLFRLSSKSNSFRDKLNVFTKSPGWQPEYLGGYQAAPEIDKENYQKYDVSSGNIRAGYSLFQFMMALSTGSILLFLYLKMDVAQNVSLALFSLTTLISCGALFEKNSWLKHFELIRLIISPVIIIFFLQLPYFYFIAATFILIQFISVIWFIRIQKQDHAQQTQLI